METLRDRLLLKIDALRVRVDAIDVDTFDDESQYGVALEIVYRMMDALDEFMEAHRDIQN